MTTTLGFAGSTNPQDEVQKYLASLPKTASNPFGYTTAPASAPPPAGMSPIGTTQVSAPPAPTPATTPAPPSTPGAQAASPTPGTFTPGTIDATLKGLNFGQPTTPVAAPTFAPTTSGGLNIPSAGSVSGAVVAPPPAITAPTVTAAQGGFNNFDQMQAAAYQSLYDPVSRQINLTRTQADQSLNSALAKAGLAESGSGIGQRVRQDQEYTRQLAAASQDAANQAATQRYGLEYAQSLDNAKLRQEANLANAGFSLTAQSENAKNLLTANVATAQNQTQAGIAGLNAQTQIAVAGLGAQTAQMQIASSEKIAQANNQLQAMGLSIQQEQGARRDYLTLLGIQEQDLARKDDKELRVLGMFYDTYLRELSIASQTGSAQFTKTDQSSSSLGVDTGISLGIGGGK